MERGVNLYPFLHHSCQHSFFPFSLSSGAGLLSTGCGGHACPPLSCCFPFTGWMGSQRVLAEAVATLLPCVTALEVSVLVVLPCVGTSVLQTHSRMPYEGWQPSPGPAWILAIRSCPLV